MGLCHSHGFRRSSSVKNRTKSGSIGSIDKDSNSTQVNDKKRGKTPNIEIKKINNDKDILSEKEYKINKKNVNITFDIISQIDKMSNYSEKIKYDLIKEDEKNNDKKKLKNSESFFNKVIKPNNNNINNNNKKPIINIRSKFNNFAKKEFETPIKLRNIDNNNYSTIKDPKSDEKNKKDKINNKIKNINNINNNKETKKINEEKLLKLLILKNRENENKNNENLYRINYNNDILKKLTQKNFNYSTEETYKKALKNLKDRNAVSNIILRLPERKWYDELISLNAFLIKYREKFDMQVLSIYLVKIIKIYEDFNWLIDSISTYYTNIKYKNLTYNKQGIDLPDVNNDLWKQGFNWKGLYIKIYEGENTKLVINEVKALNYFFFDYIQIIDRYQFIKDNQLSNNIIFPLIGYSYINGKTLVISALIEGEDKNKIINEENHNDDRNINLVNSMGKYFYVDDLLISKLFYNLNENNFIRIKNGKYIIHNLYKQIPSLCEINFDNIYKINFFSIIRNKKIFYTLNYNSINKINIHKEQSKYKTPKDLLQNLYHINTTSLKNKDIIINKVHFRILYENEIEYFSQEKKSKQKYFINENFVDNLFNYSYDKKIISKISKIKGAYIIIYDLIEPLKLQYSQIKSNKNYVLNGQNATNEDCNNNNDIEKKIYFLESNYISFFISWCKCISKNSFNIKTYSDLKQNMKKYGINSILRFFALMLIDNKDINNIIKISFLIKAIKFVFNKETNNLKYNEQGIKFILMKYINSILYPSEIINKEKEKFEHIFKELIFYSNILFLKLKLIDNYLNLGLLSIDDIKDINNNNNIKNIFNNNKNNSKLTFLNSPEEFLIHIISIARKIPFLFLSELEYKLNFIIDPYIKFKSSISIESMRKQLNMEHLLLNFNKKTISYIKFEELSGLILTKIIKRFNSFEEADIFNKIGEDKKIRNNIEISTEESNFNFFNKKLNDNYSLTKDGDEKPISPYIFNFNDHLNNNNNNNCKENITINSDIDKEYINYDDILDNIYNNEENIENEFKKTSHANGNSSSNQTSSKKIYYNITTISNLSTTNKAQNQKVEWDNIKYEFLFELPTICYKMPFFNSENEKKDKFKILSLYRNLSYEYNIINPKILLEWNELLEKIFTQINYSCNGNIERTLLYSFYYTFIYYFFFEKKSENQRIITKINKLYSHQEYKLSLNDLIIINLLKAMWNNIDFIKSEENFSKCLILILLAYGDPRGRNNDSHGIMEYPLWEICYRTVKCENFSISEKFREMFHALDYFEWNKSIIKSSNNKNNNINYENNINKNIDDILLINNINKDIYNKNKNNEQKLSEIIFDDKILNIKCIKHFSFPKMSDNVEKIENSLKSKDFILYLLKQIQSLFIGNKIILNQNYINDKISPEIFNPEKYINYLKNRNNINNIMNVINLNKNLDRNNNYYNTQRNNSAMNSHMNSNRIYNNNNYVPNEYSYKNNINIIRNTQINHFFEKINIEINTTNQRPSSIKRDSSQYNANNNNKNSNIFSRYLYKDLLEKLSYSKNLPSGVVFAFGNNRHSEISHDNLLKVTIPRIIFKLKNEYVEKIYSGWEHNIIITKKGEIFSFGENKNYQCGVPNISEKDKKINNPINISKYNNNFKALSASCGNDHTLILKNDNSVYAFGNNEEGELGLKDKNIKTYKFTKINFGSHTNKISKISAGTVHNLALTFDGKVFSWGSSQGGQLGLSEEFLLRLPGFKENYYIYEPIQIPCFNEQIIGIGCGEAHSVAVDKTGKLWTWGYGSSGQLGLGFCEDDYEPGISQHKTRIFVPQKVRHLDNEKIVDVQCGKTFSMFINEKREIFSCGVNDLNQLGIEENNFNNNKRRKICSDIVWPMKLDFLLRQKVIKLSCGEGHCLAIINSQENSNVIWSWGNNKFGQLGHGEGNDRGKRLPKPINYLLALSKEKQDNDNQIQFEDISCGGFHSLCLAKYKDDIDWIENDFIIIKNTIRNNNNDYIFMENNIYYSLNFESDIKSENIGHMNINKI